MKLKIIICLLALFNPHKIISQTLDTIFLDKNWCETDIKENALYFRIKEKIGRKKVVIKDYYISGQLQMEAIFPSTRMRNYNGLFTFYQENGNIDIEGRYINNTMVGTWKWYHENGKISAIEEYKNSERKSYTFYDEDGNEVPINMAERSAEFPGGTYAFTNFINSKIIEANLPKKRGLVKMELTINKRGEIKLVNVLESKDEDLTKEAFRIIKLMPRFIPAKEHNRKIASVINVEIRFPKKKKKRTSHNKRYNGHTG